MTDFIATFLSVFLHLFLVGLATLGLIDLAYRLHHWLARYIWQRGHPYSPEEATEMRRKVLCLVCGAPLSDAPRHERWCTRKDVKP